MGGGQSTPSPPPPPVIIEEPYPASVGADGISLSQAVKCTDCQLGVDTNISVSSVKLKRDLGDIQSTQCAQYGIDKKRVKDSYMSLEDFIYNLQSGRYSIPISEEDVKVPGSERTISQGYCAMLGITDEEAEKILTNPQFFNMMDGYTKRGRIRKVSGSGGFSSGTKARFIPSIPFKMTFAGTKAFVDENGKTQFVPFSDPFTVTQLVLYHPSPIRVDSVQADAMLSLNDPSDPAAKSVVLIPLRGTNSGDPSAEFVNRIAKYIQSVREYDTQSGLYPETPIQTGSDWTLGKLFTLDKEVGKGGTANVKNGFFTWTGVAGYERVKIDYNAELQKARETGDSPTLQRLVGEIMSIPGGASASQVIRYAWKPIDGLTTPQYFLLDSPLDINSSDLAMITRNLDPTPPTEANHTIPAEPNLVFHKSSVPPAPDTISGGSGGSCGGIANLCEGFTTGTLSDQLKESDDFETSCPGAKCDPFLQNVKQLKIGTLTTTALITAIFNAFVVIAMVVGAYVAMNMVSNDYDVSLKNSAETIGKVLAVWAKGARDRIPSMSSLKPSMPSVPSLPRVPSLSSMKPKV